MLDVVIAHRGDEIGLWMTVTSLMMDSNAANVPYKVHIVANGLEKVEDDLKFTLEALDKQKTLGSFQHFVEPLSPPSARNRGAEKGTADTILFLDNHVMLEQGFMFRGLSTLDSRKADALHSVTRYWPDGESYYHYRFTLERNFWGYQVKEPKDRSFPYLIGGGGHGAFFVRRDVWEEVEGYWDGFVGYGGEESYFELKLALMGYNNWLDPSLLHYHHPGKRPYVRDKGDDFIKNMIMAANIIGGDRWAQRTLNGLKIGEIRRPADQQRDLDVFFEEALDRSAAHAYHTQRKFKRSLNEQLVKFSRDGVAL
jgi:hypothetical protein